MMKPAGCAHAADHGKRLVIKIGSSTLTTSESKIDYAYLAEVTDQVARVRAAGWRPIVVTSAAIACGLERLSIEKRPHDMPSLQAAASVGQSALSTAYAEAFARHGIVTSTVLLTRRDTADRRAYLHARDTFDRLLELGVVPIVNENDTISVEQIRFGDNDTLAALVACLVEADLMVILSDIEGLYDANPHHHPDANLIGRVEAIGPEIMAVAGEAGTTVGSGGMITKIKAARVLMVAGIPLVVCDGHRAEAIVDAAVLRGGSMAAASNEVIARVLHEAAVEAGMPRGCIGAVTLADRAAADELMQLHGVVDVLIPRGGAGLIRHCVETSKVPVIETGTGNCHVYVHESADYDKARAIIVNAKCRRLGVCNAAETLLVDEAAAEGFLPAALAELAARGVTLHADERAAAVAAAGGTPTVPAGEADWETEYLAADLAVRVVGGVDEAIGHVNRYGTKHSEAIVAEDEAAVEAFLARVDAAAVYANASTAFTDGAEFGLGAEIGISTQKLHARGPFALDALTSYKYVLRGSGQVRA